MKKKVNKITLVLGLAVMAVLVCVRIYQVNVSAPVIATERYSMGEWVDYNGAFLSTIDENTQGYSVRITSARCISHDEYIELYGLDKADNIEGLDAKSIIVMDMEVKNAGNEEGYIYLFGSNLIPVRKNDYFIIDADLWSKTEGQLPEGEMSFILALKKDSQYTTHLPYTINDADEDNARYKKDITDTHFELLISNSPVKKVIDIQVH